MWAVADVDSEPGQDPSGLVTAKATGVLVLALRVAPDVANRALAAAAHRYGRLRPWPRRWWSGLGGLAGGDPSLSRIVRKEWGDLLD